MASDGNRLLSFRLDESTRETLRFVLGRQGVDASTFVRASLVAGIRTALHEIAAETGKSCGHVDIAIVDDPAPGVAA
jgi:antitoxin component of RelBE/YafQ-DinJ toxin-antitoxin module